MSVVRKFHAFLQPWFLEGVCKVSINVYGTFIEGVQNVSDWCLRRLDRGCLENVKLFGNSFFRTQKCWSQNFLRSRFFSIQNFFGSKNFLTPKHSWTKILFRALIFLTPNFLKPKFFWGKKFLGPKIFLNPTLFFGRKMFWIQCWS